jgi:hypothetical protein
MERRPASRFSVRWLPCALSLLLFAGLALGSAYPLWLAPGSRLEDPGDPPLNAWALAWDHDALLHQPTRFFQANVFWPNRWSLAYGEHLLTEALLALPFRALTANPVTLHNLSIIQGTFLCCVAAWLLGLHYFRRAGPAAICGVAYGLAAYRINHSSHLQLLHGEFLPLIVLAFERLLAGGGWRWRWLLGLSIAGQCLASWYWAVFAFWTAGPYMIARLWSARRVLDRRRVEAMVLPVALAGACILAMAWPYAWLFGHGDLERRDASDAAHFRGHPMDYLAPSRHALFYDRLARDHDMERRLFPGAFAIAGFLVSLGRSFRRKTGRDAPPTGQDAIRSPVFPLRLWVAITTMLLSFTAGHWVHVALGAKGARMPIPLPLDLIAWFPMISQIRVPPRWMLPATLGLALLGADAWRWLWDAKWRHARLIAVIGCIGLAADVLPAPLDYMETPAASPAALEWLNRQPKPSPVFMIPHLGLRLMWEAAWLRQPIVNGYNGYLPPGHETLLAVIAKEFPSAMAIGQLRGLGVRFVVVNLAEATSVRPGWNPARLPALLEQPPGLPKPRRIGQSLIFDLAPTETSLEIIRANYDLAIETALRYGPESKGRPKKPG